MVQPLFGRERELAALGEAIAGTRAGVGGCTIVTGAPGIGKTSLLAAATERARAEGLAVAAWHASELDRIQPLHTLLSALRTTSPAGLDLAALTNGGGDRFRHIDRIEEALERYVADRPLLIAVDDAQWTDELSVLALRVLVPALASSPLRWLFARRSVPAGTPAQEAIDWLLGQGAEQLLLEPLSDRAIGALCRNVVGAEVDATVLALADRSSGNPFLLKHLLDTLVSTDQLVVAEGIASVVGDQLPMTFLAEVNQRLRGLSEQARRLLRAGTVFRRPFTVHAAARLAGVPPTEMVSAAEEMVAAGLLAPRADRLEFCHDLLREALYNNMSSPVRAALHREAAEIVRDEGGSVVEIAEQLRRTGDDGGPAAAQVLREAAAELAGPAPGTAADMIVRALELLGEYDERRPRYSADAVVLLAAAGRIDEAQKLGETTLDGRLDASTEATVLTGLAEALKHRGDNAGAVEYARRGLTKEGLPDSLRARLYAVAAHGMLYSADMAGADAAGAEADRLGVASGEYAASAFGGTARAVVARTAGRLDLALAHAQRAVDIADEAGGEALHRHPRVWLGSALAALDRFDEAEAAYATGRRQAQQLGTGWSQPLWHHYRAYLLFGLGRLDEAVAEAEAGLHIADQLTARQLCVPLYGLLARIAVWRDQMPAAVGYRQRMEDLIDRGITAAPEDVTWPIAVIEDASGRPQRALHCLSSLYDSLGERMLLLANDPACSPALVRIALAAGDRMRAQAAAGAARRLADLNPSVASLTGVADHAEGLLRYDLAALRRAVDQLRDSRRRLARASAREDAARAEDGAGNRAAAVELLRQAVDEYADCGAHRAVARLEARLHRLGAGRAARSGPPEPKSPRDTLSPAERSVAELVAEGMTNRQIAERLRISPHTVDSHLRHIFDKLGVHGRTLVARMMAAD